MGVEAKISSAAKKIRAKGLKIDFTLGGDPASAYAVVLKNETKLEQIKGEDPWYGQKTIGLLVEGIESITVKDSFEYDGESYPITKTAPVEPSGDAIIWKIQSKTLIGNLKDAVSIYDLTQEPDNDVGMIDVKTAETISAAFVEPADAKYFEGVQHAKGVTHIVAIYEGYNFSDATVIEWHGKALKVMSQKPLPYDNLILLNCTEDSSV